MNLIGENDLITEQAEQAVLGAIFIESSVLDDITFLEHRDFLSERHQQIYKVMRYLEKRNVPVDIVTVTETYVKFGRVESMGGVPYLRQLAESCPTTSNIDFYAQIVRSKALERRARNMGEIITGMSRDDYETDEDFFTNIEQLVSEMRPQDTAKMKGFSESRSDYFDHLKKKAQVIKTGFRQFDIWAKGAWRGWLWISAGRPSVGKTAMLLQRIFGMAKQHDGAVLLWSQEMDENQVKDRMISNITGIPYSKFRDKNFNEKEWSLVNMAYEELEYLPIFIQDSAGITIEEIKATAKQFKKKYGSIACIAVDYLQIMKIPQKKGETRAQAIGEVTRTAKQIAREMNCVFIMLSQLSRGFEQALKPQFSHLKESGSIEQDADVIEFLWHDPNDTDKEGKVIQQTIAKGRDTGLNEFRLLFKGWIQRFEEIAKERSKQEYRG